MTRHFLDLASAGKDGLRAILNEAHRRKSARAGRPKGAPDDDAPLAGHALACIFEKPSTRTRVSFDMAMRQLGGSALVLAAGDLQLGRGESIPDTARVLSRYVDAVMIRANRHADVETLANHSSVPVVNGLTNLNHPCQVVADMMTFEERFARPVEGSCWAWLGDGNNVLNSIIEAGSLMGFDVNAATPGGFEPDSGVMATACARGGCIGLHHDPGAALEGADVVVTDTWVSMGEAESAAKVAALTPFRVTPERMAQAKPGALFLHCLPAHRGDEVTDAVIDGAQSAVWDEAENRLHAQKAILLWCLGKTMSDQVLGFTVPKRSTRGRLGRMTVSLREVLAAHDYPAPLAHLLGEALMLTVLLGSTLRETDGQVTLQAQAEGGPVELLVCDWRTGNVRGYLQLRDGAPPLQAGATLAEAFGTGYLAITLEQTEAAERYQGIRPARSASLCEAVEGYFTTSEQLPTLLRVAVAETADGWVAGGLLAQHLPTGEIGQARLSTKDGIDPDWQHVATLTGSVSRDELTDEALPLETLLWRLLNEDEVRITPAIPLTRFCHCSADHFRTVLLRFPEEERAEMRNDEGLIVVNCEFCSKTYPLDI